jgi:hypothetical protein
MVGGQPRFRTLSAATIGEVRRQREPLQSVACIGELPVSPRLTFAQVAVRWLAEFEAKVMAGERRDRTLDLYRSQLYGHLCPGSAVAPRRAPRRRPLRRGRLPMPRLGCVVDRCLGVAFCGALVVSVAAGTVSAARLPAPVYRTVAVTADGRIYVLGGHDAAGGTITEVYVFAPGSGVSRPAGALALATHGAAAANLGGRSLVFGGASSSVHDVVQQFFPRAAAAAWSGICRACEQT